MSRFEDREHVAGKIEWEGGMEMALDYGIKAADMPKDDAELEAAWTVMEEKWDDYREEAAKVLKLLELD